MALESQIQPSQNDIDALTADIRKTAAVNFHRFLLVFEGHPDWTQIQAERLVQNLQPSCKEDVIFVSEASSLAGGTNSKAINSFLGRECDLIIWDGHSTLDANGIAAACGLIRGGGLFALLLSEESAKEDLTLFELHLRQTLKNNTQVSIIQQDKPVIKPAVVTPKVKSGHKSNLPNDAQLHACDAIKKVLTGHRKRPLVIEADRGRGKSTALAYASAEIIQSLPGGKSIMITAPLKANTEIFFQHVTKLLNQDLSKNIQYAAPDSLLREPRDCSLLLIDEAAALPSPILEGLLHHYSRVVLASTIHGYEGTGMGFELRFKSKLDQNFPGWKRLRMEEPVRWAKDDPLEAWSFETFALKSHNAISKSFSFDQLKSKTSWIERTDLLQDSSFLQDTMSLLTLAHYQTKPSDLQMLLDHPDLKVAQIYSQADENEESKLIGLAVVLIEGGLEDKDLSEAIANGSRRPPGHLVPQALANYTGIAEHLEPRSWRIMRIVVNPMLLRNRLGTKLIEFVAEEAKRNNIDYLSASFGANSEVLQFWLASGFQINWLGYHRDKSSGYHSAFVTRSINDDSKEILEKTTRSFYPQFIYSLPSIYLALEATLALMVLKQLSDYAQEPSAEEKHLANMFACQNQSLENCHRAIEKIYLYYFAANQEDYDSSLSLVEHQILIEVILQKRKWHDLSSNLNICGKKSGISVLRKVVKKIL